jgi:hypothetical protein
MFGALVMPNGTTVFVFGARASAAGGDTAIVVLRADQMARGDPLATGL